MLPQVLVAIEQMDLYYQVSPYKTIPYLDDSGYPDEGIRIPIYNPLPGHVVLFASLTPGYVDLFKEYERHDFEFCEEIGELLGYPICCINFFTNCMHFMPITRCTDCMLYTLRNTNGSAPYSWYTNNVARTFGYTLISHYPCSYSCENTISMGKEYFAAIQAFSTTLSQEIFEKLTSPILYSKEEGIIFFDQVTRLSETEFEYDMEKIQVFPQESSLPNKITNYNVIKYIEKNHVILENSRFMKSEEMNSKSINLFLFS